MFPYHVSLPCVYGFSDLYKLFKEKGLTERIVFIGSGKLEFPAKAAMAFAMGTDCINVAR
jgi:glutamate synthase domain-containing protein 2